MRTRWYSSAKVFALLALAMVLWSVAATAFANPAIEEYKPRFPSASGDKHGSDATNVDPTNLPVPIVGGLVQDPNGKALAVIATSHDLGAPDFNRTDTSGDSSLTGALLRSLLDPIVWLVGLAMIGIAVGAWRARRES